MTLGIDGVGLRRTRAWNGRQIGSLVVLGQRGRWRNGRRWSGWLLIRNRSSTTTTEDDQQPGHEEFHRVIHFPGEESLLQNARCFGEGPELALGRDRKTTQEVCARRSAMSRRRSRRVAPIRSASRIEGRSPLAHAAFAPRSLGRLAFAVRTTPIPGS